ncbi:MAG: ABC transporter permease [Oscillospiraceae bacterium]|nr:ABC transporter permease [Oscillospiraceae bacterium]
MTNGKRIAENTVKSLLLPAGMFLLMLLLTQFFGRGQFATGSSMISILRNTMLGSCISLAMACNMLNGRWDFSIGMMVILVPVLAMPIVDWLNIGIPGLLLVCIVIGLLLGLLNAAAYLLIRVPSIVTSLGLMTIYESVITVYNGGGGARISDSRMLALGQAPWVFILAVTAFLIFFVLFTFTKFGYHVRALAASQALAVNGGIRERGNVLGCYLLCGFLAGVAGIIYVTMTGILLADMRQNGSSTIMFQAFPPVFIGFFLMKYTNLTAGIIIGTFTMKLLLAGMLAIGISSTLQDVGVGVFLLVFIAFTSNQSKFQEARKARAYSRMTGKKSGGGETPPAA